MSTVQWVVLDHAVALLTTAAWFGAGAAAALRRRRIASAALLAAVVLLLARGITVGALAGSGWWFVQEKIVLGLPVQVVTATAALALAWRPLVRSDRPVHESLPSRAVVVLFTAAAASLSSLAVTLLGGYPLEWAATLVALAVVGAGGLLAAHVIKTDGGGPRSSTPVPRSLADGTPPALSRRSFLNVAGGIAVAGTAGSGVGLLARAGPTHDLGGGPAPALPALTPVTDLRGPRSPAPGGVTVRHELTAQRSAIPLGSGREFDAWTFNAQAPGPAIVASQGDLLEVTLRNADIDDGVSLHWHGYDVPCGEDGVPGTTQDAVRPGEEFVYRFAADQVGTYWYHTHQTSHIGVRKGLYGTLVVHPRKQDLGPTGAGEGVDLVLPLHTFDDVLVIGQESAPTQHLVRSGRPVRLRIVNTDSDPHWIALVGSSFRVIAVDGRDLNHPEAVSQVGLRLAAGGRYDLAFDMPDSRVQLIVDHDHDVRVDLAPEGSGSDAVAFDTTGWPELDLLSYGSPVAHTLATRRPDRHFSFVLDRGVAMLDGRPALAQTVNGSAHPGIPDQLVAEGDVVKFTVANRSLETHPWHLHGHPVLVLSRNGIRSSGSPLWVDTFDVRPGEVWEVVFQATNPGVWMNHCHNLPHAEQGMMLQLVYEGIAPLDSGTEDHGH